MQQIAQIRAAQRGDLRAQQVLFEAWLPVVMGWCARLGGPYVDPEDAAQDVLIRAFDKLEELRQPESFNAWMYSLTRRVLAWHRRRVWFRRWLPGATIERIDPREDPEHDVADAEIARLVHDILEGLPANQREVIVLCCIEERSTAEAATLIGISHGTVKSRLRRGKARFADLARCRGLRPDAPSLVAVSP